MSRRRENAPEWPTVLVALATYGSWLAGVFAVSSIWLPAGVVLTTLAIAQHASLTHEAIHGHPFRSDGLNAMLVWPAVGLLYPYRRFRDTHLAHHLDCDLTDPYDDPESNFLEPKDWASLSRPLQTLLVANNTLLGRLVLGPVIGTVFFLQGEMRRAEADPSVLKGWLAHLPAAAVVVLLVMLSPMPLWAYFLAAYLGNGMIRIRTFLEHRAHETARARSVIIEDKGPLAFLFLNNNLHAVHHMHPKVPWYKLPALYRANRERFLTANDGYRYPSYREVIRQHLLTPKDPVPHPLRPSE